MWCGCARTLSFRAAMYACLTHARNESIHGTGKSKKQFFGGDRQNMVIRVAITTLLATSMIF